MKSKLIYTVLFVFCSYIAFNQNYINAEREGTTLKGKLIADVNNRIEVITLGHIFALSADRKQVLGYTTPSKGSYNTSGGDWEINGLPKSGKIIMVGFASNVKRLMWIQEINLDGRKWIHLGDNLAYIPNPPTSPESTEGYFPLLQSFYLLGWFTEQISNGNYYKQIDLLSDNLMKYVNAYSSKASIPCNTLMDGNPFNNGNYSKFPITHELKPRVPVSINIAFTLNDINGCSMLFRYGDYGIASQISICNGLLSGDFREGKIGDINGGAAKILGNRSLESRISSGYHEIKFTYDGEKAQLWVDNVMKDQLYGYVDISKYDGNIWVGRNGYATYPFYFKGTIHKVLICFD
jgi:hypothetical protein